ncbi:MAG: PilX N-terminal domain-containing pilus assembly protein [Wenzhouxiangella sp.]
MNNTIGFCAVPRGVALIFALLLLLVLTVLGVATMSSVAMQERMASNANLQALAFKAASAGITESLEWGLDSGSWPTDDDGQPLICLRGQGDWMGGWVPAEGADGSELDIPGIPAGFRVEYRKRVGCFEAPDWELLTGFTEDPPQQLLVLSRGDVIRSADSTVLATREIEVRLENRGNFNGTCLIQTGPLSDNDLRMPDSQAFGIDARPDGCPIKTANGDDAAEMLDQLRENQVGNYLPTDPGITSGELEGAWGNPHLLARVVNSMKIGMRASTSWIDQFGPDTNPFAACSGTLHDNHQDWKNANSCGATVAGGLTYVAGDLEVAGNCTVHGTIMVEGAYLSNGAPAYTGDLLFLGGLIDIRGFGNAESSGLIILQHLADNIDPQSVNVAYDPENVTNPRSSFIVHGGGNATIRPHECEVLQASWIDMNNCLDDLQGMVETAGDPDIVPEGGSLFDAYAIELGLASNLDIPDLLREDEEHPARFPIPVCDPDGNNRRKAIASWREFIDQGRWAAAD